MQRIYDFSVVGGRIKILRQVISTPAQWAATGQKFQSSSKLLEQGCRITDNRDLARLFLETERPDHPDKNVMPPITELQAAEFSPTNTCRRSCSSNNKSKTAC